MAVNNPPILNANVKIPTSVLIDMLIVTQKQTSKNETLFAEAEGAAKTALNLGYNKR